MIKYEKCFIDYQKSMNIETPMKILALVSRIIGYSDIVLYL